MLDDLFSPDDGAAAASTAGVSLKCKVSKAASSTVDLPVEYRDVDDLTEEELQPHFFTPNFLRPVPVPELEDDDDFEDAYWLIPGIVPEPYWDINMGLEFNYSQLKYYLTKALKMPLAQKEIEHIQKAFKND